VLYKDKGGRKTVAIGANVDKPYRSKTLTILGGILNADLDKSIAELSGGALVTMLKAHDFDAIKPFIFTMDDASKVLKKQLMPVEYDALEEKDKTLYDRFPKLKDHFYVREIGGHMHMKVLIGTVKGITYK
jgi:hypothetical protein